MGVKISELPEATSVQEEDIMPIVQNGETKKVSMSKVGGNEVFIGDTEEAPDTAKLAIDDDGMPMFSSEVVNSLSGDETAKAPSVHAVKDALSYSTSEVNTNETWINGKPIYKKVVDIGTLPNATTKQVNHDITNIDRIIKLYGVAWETGSTWTIVLPASSPTGSNNINLSASGTVLNIQTGTNRTDWSGYVVVEYTKTTDTATRSIPVQEETRNIETPVEEPSEEETR